MALNRVNGIVEIPSNHSVDRTVQKLEDILNIPNNRSAIGDLTDLFNFSPAP